MNYARIYTSVFLGSARVSLTTGLYFAVAYCHASCIKYDVRHRQMTLCFKSRTFLT